MRSCFNTPLDAPLASIQAGHTFRPSFGRLKACNAGGYLPSAGSEGAVKVNSRALKRPASNQCPKRATTLCTTWSLRLSQMGQPCWAIYPGVCTHKQSTASGQGLWPSKVSERRFPPCARSDVVSVLPFEMRMATDSGRGHYKTVVCCPNGLSNPHLTVYSTRLVLCSQPSPDFGVK